MVEKYYNKHGELKFKGGRNLKPSQHYPRGFGTAVRKMALKHQQSIKATQARLMRDAHLTRNPFSDDDWSDACLSDVIDILVH